MLSPGPLLLCDQKVSDYIQSEVIATEVFVIGVKNNSKDQVEICLPYVCFSPLSQLSDSIFRVVLYVFIVESHNAFLLNFKCMQITIQNIYS